MFIDHTINFTELVTMLRSSVWLSLSFPSRYWEKLQVMCSLTVLPVSWPWYWMWRSVAHSSSSMSQSFGSCSLKLTARLCKMQHATIMVHILSGAILTSECSTWNVLFNYPKVCSMVHCMILCALLKYSSWSMK